MNLDLDEDDRQATVALAAGALQLVLLLAALTACTLWGVGVYHLVRWLT